VNPRLIDWIWNVRGSLVLAPRQSSDDAFDKLDPLFRQTGTSFERSDDTLVFSKKNQAAQDKMSVFDGGVLQIERGVAGPVLRYRLTSRALLLCFLAPLLFLGFAQLTIAIGKIEKPATEAANKSEKEAAEDPAEKYASMPMNPIDEFLGAPAPEKPQKDGKDKDKKEDKKPSPTPAYVFAAIFAALYLVGRVLEDWLIKERFRKRLLGL
jgi:hypothetical protein